MAVATLRHHNSTFINNHSSSINPSSASHIGSRSSGEILQAQLQQGSHNTHAQTAAAGNLWDLANSSDMSYELAAAGTGKDKTVSLVMTAWKPIFG